MRERAKWLAGRNSNNHNVPQYLHFVQFGVYSDLLAYWGSQLLQKTVGVTLIGLLDAQHNWVQSPQGNLGYQMIENCLFLYIIDIKEFDHYWLSHSILEIVSSLVRSPTHNY